MCRSKGTRAPARPVETSATELPQVLLNSPDEPDEVARVELRVRLRLRVMGASLHALAFFGGLFAYAHALPGMLDAAGIGYEAWIPEAAYFGCIVLAGLIGGVVNCAFPDDEQQALCDDERRRRAGRKRIPRLLSGATTLTGLLASVQFPADSGGLPTWPIVVMGCFTGLYTLLHWQLRRQHGTDRRVEHHDAVLVTSGTTTSVGTTASTTAPRTAGATSLTVVPPQRQPGDPRRRRGDTRYVTRTVRTARTTRAA